MKSNKGVSLYSRFVNRPVGRVLARAAVRLGVSANAVTALSAVVAVAAFVLLCAVRPSVGTGIAVALLLALSFALDSADGQVSRMTGTSSAAGEWFDHVVDAGKHVSLHAAVLVGWFRYDVEGGAWLAVPLLFQVVTVVTFSGMTTALLLKRTQPQRGSGAGGGSLVRSVGLLPADHGVLCLSFVLWGVGDVFPVAYAVLLVLNAAILVAFLRKWFRELVAGEAAPA